MKARLLLRQKLTDSDGDLKELVAWRVVVNEKHPEGVRYRLAFIPQGHKQPAVLYDNHHPKGHHKHVDESESLYSFSGARQLIEDFEKDVVHWKRKRGQ
ncbi:MAG: hypothetical protein HY401_03940 [Elusimicrobia bacterium]|nr:hypothetical protein [Elusimicrobiota bacterium]